MGAILRVRGEDGNVRDIPAIVGKSAYQYAVDGGFEGTEEEFTQMMASGGGSDYNLPIASATQLGGVKPAAKTDEMTQEVGVDAEGKLFTAPGSGGEAFGTPTWTVLASGTIAADGTEAKTITDTGITWDMLLQYKRVYIGINGNTGSGSAWSILSPTNNTASWALLKFSNLGSGGIILKRVMEGYWEIGGYSSVNVHAPTAIGTSGPYLYSNTPYVRFDNIWRLSGTTTIKFYNDAVFTTNASWTISALSY